MAGCKRFRDIELEIDLSEGREIESDVFLYNECNLRDHNLRDHNLRDHNLRDHKVSSYNMD